MNTHISTPRGAAWNQKTASKGVEHTNLISGCIIFLVSQAFSELFGVDSNNNEWEQSRHYTHLSELLEDEDERLAITTLINASAMQPFVKTLSPIAAQLSVSGIVAETPEETELPLEQLLEQPPEQVQDAVETDVHTLSAKVASMDAVLSRVLHTQDEQKTEAARRGDQFANQFEDLKALMMGVINAQGEAMQRLQGKEKEEEESPEALPNSSVHLPAHALGIELTNSECRTTSNLDFNHMVPPEVMTFIHRLSDDTVIKNTTSSCPSFLGNLVRQRASSLDFATMQDVRSVDLCYGTTDGLSERYLVPTTTMLAKDFMLGAISFDDPFVKDPTEPELFEQHVVMLPKARRWCNKGYGKESAED
jgi:hypothetical protein